MSGRKFARGRRLQRADVSTVLAAALRAPAGPPIDPGSTDVPRFTARARQHRVLLLLGWLVRQARRLPEWPATFADAFARAERAAVIHDCVRTAELVRVLAALRAADVCALVLKGAAIAHTHYPAPHLRVRQDTDLFILEADRTASECAFRRLGYSQAVETSGRFVSYQCHYHRRDHLGVDHAIDLHWRISNVQALAPALTFGRVWDHRVPVAGVGPDAFAPGAVDALVIALVHRAGHHPGSRNLLWLYDLHLLIDALSSPDAAAFEEAIEDRGLTDIAREGVSIVADTFGTACATHLLETFSRGGGHGRRGDVAAPAAGSTQADILRLDLAALPDWRSRVRLVAEHLFPPASYIRERYGLSSKWPVGPWYAWRILRGAPGWLRRTGAADE